MCLQFLLHTGFNNINHSVSDNIDVCYWIHGFPHKVALDLITQPLQTSRRSTLTVVVNPVVLYQILVHRVPPYLYQTFKQHPIVPYKLVQFVHGAGMEKFQCHLLFVAEKMKLECTKNWREIGMENQNLLLSLSPASAFFCSACPGLLNQHSHFRLRNLASLSHVTSSLTWKRGSLAL